MFHKIIDVVPLENYILMVTFENNSIKYYDIKKILDKWPYFNSLLYVNNLFEQVQIDTGGYGISWNEELDLSANELWDNGQSENIFY